MNIAQRITVLLKEQNKTQKALAEYLGITGNAITNWKIKGTNPSIELIPKISEFFNVSCDFIITGYNYVEPQDELKAEYLQIFDELSSERERIELLLLMKENLLKLKELNKANRNVG